MTQTNDAAALLLGRFVDLVGDMADEGASSEDIILALNAARASAIICAAEDEDTAVSMMVELLPTEEQVRGEYRRLPLEEEE